MPKQQKPRTQQPYSEQYKQPRTNRKQDCLLASFNNLVKGKSIYKGKKTYTPTLPFALELETLELEFHFQYGTISTATTYPELNNLIKTKLAVDQDLSAVDESCKSRVLNYVMYFQERYALSLTEMGNLVLLDTDQPNTLELMYEQLSMLYRKEDILDPVDFTQHTKIAVAA